MSNTSLFDRGSIGQTRSQGRRQGRMGAAGGWQWLMLLGLGWAGPAAAQGVVAEVNQVFQQRLENTFRYQEAVLPAGVTRARRYLRVGKRRYLVETVGPDGRSVVRDDYQLRIAGKDTLPVSNARYELSGATPYERGQQREALFHAYDKSPLIIGLGDVQAGRLMLRQEFSPLDILRLRPADTARAGQTLYVLNRQPDLYGDTLACYELRGTGTGWDTYSVVLRERKTQARRQWHDNNRIVFEWEVNPEQREITATRYTGRSRGRSYWVRTYKTAALTDFTEVHYSTFLVGHARERAVYYYRREFRRLSPQQSRDTYTTLFDEDNPKPTFTIVSDYQK